LVVNILYIGRNDENPSNFEEMFRWWQQVWKENIEPQPDQPILLCLKGGVGQASEASRISGLSLYGNDIKFYEFIPTPHDNQKGISSDYTGPFLGTNYLWDRTRQQALQLLERYDYAGLQNLVKPYYEQNKQKWKETYALIKSGVSWNQGQFEDFFQSASFSFNNQQKEQHQQYWWMAYEQAYTAVVRLKQKNTTEAMLHSFRAVEGLIYECLKHEFKDYMVNSEYTYSSLQSSVLNKYPALKELFVNNGNPVSEIKLDSRTQQRLIEKYIALTSPQANFKNLKAWGSEELRNHRNRLSHKLGGISEGELYQAWGKDTYNQKDWEKRILNCLNLITENKFNYLWQGSLFASIHERVRTAIKNYNVV
jgi:hypothetical protein